MMASMQFDPRLIWDPVDEDKHQPNQQHPTQHSQDRPHE